MYDLHAHTMWSCPCPALRSHSRLSVSTAYFLLSHNTRLFNWITQGSATHSLLYTSTSRTSTTTHQSWHKASSNSRYQKTHLLAPTSQLWQPLMPMKYVVSFYTSSAKDNLTLSSFCEIKYVEIKFFVRQIFYLQLRNVFILGRLCRVQMRSLCTALTTTWMRLRLMASPGWYQWRTRTALIEKHVHKSMLPYVSQENISWLHVLALYFWPTERFTKNTSVSRMVSAFPAEKHWTEWTPVNHMDFQRLCTSSSVEQFLCRYVYNVRSCRSTLRKAKQTRRKEATVTSSSTFLT